EYRSGSYSTPFLSQAISGEATEATGTQRFRDAICSPARSKCSRMGGPARVWHWTVGEDLSRRPQSIIFWQGLSTPVTNGILLVLVRNQWRKAIRSEPYDYSQGKKPTVNCYDSRIACDLRGPCR